jgi:predicted RNase H-like HicB family nuclease
VEDVVELSVLIQQVAGNGFRASCGEPIAATAEGATREEALTNLRNALQARVRGAEVVRLTIPIRTAPTTAVWPDDPITRDWLDGIAATRKTADENPDPWDAPLAGDQP